LAVKEKGSVISKKLWVYLPALLVVAGFWATITIFYPKKAEEIKIPPLFPNLTSDKIQELQWQRGQEIIHLKKKKGWEIIQPITVSADSDHMEGILQTLSSLKPERRFSEPGKNLKEFGLDYPKMRLLFLSQGKWSEIQVGNKNVAGNAYYLKSSNSTDLFLIDEYLVKELNQDLMALREKKVFSFTLDQVRGLEIRTNKKSLSLEKDTKGWISKVRPEKRLIKEKVDFFISDLLWLKAKGFAGQGSKDPKWGLKDPLYQVRLWSEGKDRREEVLILGAEIPQKGLCSMSTLHKEVVFLDPSILKKIPQGLEEWEDKTPPPAAKKGP
jgi:Domain of unknown function (DUF4340)